MTNLISSAKPYSEKLESGGWCSLVNLRKVESFRVGCVFEYRVIDQVCLDCVEEDQGKWSPRIVEGRFNNDEWNKSHSIKV